jgi:hypothetical protein
MSREEKIQFMASMGEEAKRMSNTTGVLVWLLPNMNIKVREWREGMDTYQ